MKLKPNNISGPDQDYSNYMKKNMIKVEGP